MEEIDYTKLVEAQERARVGLEHPGLSQEIKDLCRRVFDSAESALNSAAKSEAIHELLDKRQDARHNVRVLIVAGMRPNVTAEKREIYRNLERSFRAEMTLLQRAIQHLKDPKTVVNWRER